MKIEITNDLFNIITRLKQIDADYFVMYNTKKQKFELHHHAYSKNTYCLTFPYSTLDARAIEHAHKTSNTNSDKLFFEIESANEKLEKELTNKILDECDYKFKDIGSFVTSSSKTLNYNQIHSNKWI